MDGTAENDVQSVIDNLMWTDLEIDDQGHVNVNELGRYLRQNGLDVSNFAILRIVSDGQIPRFTMDHDMFVEAKSKLKTELSSQVSLTSEERKRKYRAHYLDSWREFSRSKDDDGEIPISELPHVVFSECNPTRDYLDALVAIKSDGSESLNFEEFCELLENLPKSGMIDEAMLLRAFRTEDVDGSGFITRSQLYSLLIENGSDPLRKEDVDEMMEDCGIGEKFKYKDWIQRVVAIKSVSEK